MDISTLISPILQVGLAPVLLLLFVKYFFDKDKAREAQINELNAQFEKREELLRTDMTRREEQYEDRERIIVAENAQREELIKKEADKRERILREEAVKRESALLSTIENFATSMKDLVDNMTSVKKTTLRLEQKVDSMDDKLEKMTQGGAANG